MKSLHALGWAAVAAFPFVWSSAKAADFIYGTASSGGIFEVNTTTQTQKLVVSTAAGANAVAIDRTRNQLFYVDASNNLQVWRNLTTPITQVATAAQLGAVLNNANTQPRNAAFFGGSFWYFGLNSNILNRVSFNYDANQTPSFASRLTYNLTEVPNTGCPTSDQCNRFGDIVISPSGILFAQATGGPGNNNRLYRVNLNSLPANPLDPIPSGYYSEITLDSGQTNLQIAYNSTYTLLRGTDADNGQWYNYTTSAAGVPSGVPVAITGFVLTPGLSDVSDSATTIPIPFPLPIAGAAVGLAWSRKLRRRINIASSSAAK